MTRISICVALLFATSCKSQTGNQATSKVEPTTQQVKQSALFIAANLPDSLLPRFGKYGCTSTQYKGGFYEYTPRGSFEITKDGHYTYHGFDEPSERLHRR